MQKKNNIDVTVVILSKNEEDVIGAAICSALVLTPNILIIDSFSTDRTVKIARSLGARIISNKLSDFSSQRNFALKNVKTNWVLYLDADEELSSEIIEEIDGIIKSDVDIFAGYYITRKTYYFGKDWKYVDRVQRLFRTRKIKEWKGVVHETPVVDGKLGVLKNSVLHHTHRDLSQMLTKTNEWSRYEAELRYVAKHPKMNPIRFTRVMITAFFDSYIKQKGWKNGTYGLIEGMYQAFSMFITYAKLWEMQEQKMRKEEK